MGLFRQPKIKDGVAAQATVVDMSNPRRDDDAALIDIQVSARIHVRFRLRVEIPGQAPYEVKYGCQVKPKKMPHVGAVLPVTVARDDPNRLRIEWDDAPDAARNPNGLRFKSPIVIERSTIEVDLEPAAFVPAPPVPRPAAGDPVIVALERLVALRDAGVLTQEEFEAQKARTLGSR